MPFLACEARLEEGVDQLVGDIRSDDPRTEAEHVRIVVLHSLMGGVRVVGDHRPDTRHLVGSNAGAGPRAADDDAPIGPAVGDGPAHRFSEVGVVDR